MIFLNFIIPTYNRYELTSRAIHSCIEYTCNNFDRYAITIIDDCSTDNSFDRLKAEFSNYLHIPNFILASLKINCGVVSARNIGAMLVKSRWIALIDSDNQIIPNQRSSIENCLNTFQSPLVLFRCVDMYSNQIGPASLPKHATIDTCLNYPLPELFGIYSREVYLHYHRTPLLENIRRFEAYAFYNIIEKYKAPIFNINARIYDTSSQTRLSTSRSCRRDADFMCIGYLVILARYFIRLKPINLLSYLTKVIYYFVLACLFRPIRFIRTIWLIVSSEVTSSHQL